MIDPRSILARIRSFLVGIWHTRMGKVTALVLVLSPWIPWLLCIPGVWYGAQLFSAAMRRLLWSVRAKLAAFYLYAALLPVLLFGVVLLLVLYVVLGQVSARVIESRLGRQVEWAEQRTRELEDDYWRTRASGLAPEASIRAAVQRVASGVQQRGFGCWAVGVDGKPFVVEGPVQPVEMSPPAWLGERRFVGIAAQDSNQLVLRSRLRLVDGSNIWETGFTLPVDGRIVNHGLDGNPQELHGALGPPGRSLRECEALPDSTLEQQGVLAHLIGGNEVVVRRGEPAPAPVPAASDSLSWRSRYPLLYWLYVGHPVDWHNGSTVNRGPGILTTFSVEGAVRELMRTGVGLNRGVLWFAATLVGTLVFLQIIATLRGIVYARAISNAVAKLDRGVRAIRAGDFGYRVAPKERDQLGALSLAFNDMSGRLQGLLEERAGHQAVERELSIARDVQRRLFPERAPVAPFLQGAGICVPARTVSGDYYDFVEVAGGWDTVVADVSGKGMSAALLMASLHSALRSLYLRHGQQPLPDIGEVTTHLNEHFNTYLEPSRFVTLFLARYRGDGRLEYCNAGHNPAALVQDGRIEWLASGGLMLGPFPDLEYRPAIVAVKPGDLLCIYTDGLTESESPQGEQFGEERLASILLDVASETPREALSSVQQRVRAWRGEREASDDLTLVLLRIAG